MTPSVVIKSLNDAKNYFGEHSHIGPLIKACDTAPNGRARDTALHELAESLKHMMNADVSGLEAEAKAA